MASQQAFDSYLDSLTPTEYEQEFGGYGNYTDDYTAEQLDAFGPSGWTSAMIEQYEADLELADCPF